jgi:hypothetical protein
VCVRVRVEDGRTSAKRRLPHTPQPFHSRGASEVVGSDTGVGRSLVFDMWAGI